MSERGASLRQGSRRRLSERQAGEICRRSFLRPRSVTRLVGYDNENFRIEDGDGRRYVLKAAPPPEDRRRLDLELGVLRYLEEIGWPGVPRWLRSRFDRDLERVEVDGSELEVRLMSWVEGRPLAAARSVEAAPLPAHLLEELGALLARLDLALGRHRPAVDPPVATAWNLAETERWLELARNIEEREVRGRAVAALEGLERSLTADGDSLRSGLIHADANDYNVLVAGRGRRTRLVGMIDFGDCGEARMVFELAVAATYAGIEADDPWSVVPPLTAGYCTELPLEETELELLLPAVRARLAVSLAMSATRRRRGTADAYTSVSERPARRALARLSDLSEQQALDRLAAHLAERGDG